MIYVPGLLTGQLSGKAGSSIASKNPYAATMGVHRHRSSPQTPRASTVRASFAALQALYQSLTSAEVQAWHDLGITMFVPGRLSRTYTLTAPGAFMSVNRIRQVIGQAVTTTAPALIRPDAAILTSLLITGSNPGPASIVLELGTDPLAVDTAVAIYGQKLRKGNILTPPRFSWQLVSVLAAGSSGPWDITADYIATCGDVLTGQTAWVNARPYSLEGFIGGASVLQAVAT